MDRTPATHDLGGAERFRCTAIDPEDDAPPDAFGREVDAIRALVSAAGLLSVDELRRGIEAIPEADYHALGYYERWLRSICAILLEKGVIAPEELA
jgi:hypothetical protein